MMRWSGLGEENGGVAIADAGTETGSASVADPLPLSAVHRVGSELAITRCASLAQTRIQSEVAWF